MIYAHNLLASLRTNADPEETLRRFYTTVITTVDGIEYTAAHFLGGYYLSDNRVNCHPNWINVRFEKIFNPVIGRALIQRPTLAKTRLSTPTWLLQADVDPYELLTCYSEENVEILLDILTDVSSFISTELPSSKKLGQLIGEPYGVNILYHSIWSNTLPTWHQIPPAPMSTPQDTRIISDKAFSSHLRLYKSAPHFKSTLTPGPTDIDLSLYLVGNLPYSTDNPVWTYEVFDKQTHVTPDVFWFQPYIKNPSAINYSVTLGLLIENGSIDGVTVSIPNIRMSLTENNSMFLQRSVPLNHLIRYTLDGAVTANVYQIERKIHETEPIGLAMNNCSTVLVPKFGTEHIRANTHRIFGAKVHENCNDPNSDFTYTAWSHEDPLDILPNKIHLWSSYRYVQHSNTARRLIHFYYTMRQFYGENVTLSRTRNPTLLIPS